ncbi:MAG TPA: zinc ribbon domain-containing protein [Anaerolineae bacterium]
MPIFEYDCAACGVSFEKLVRSSANADKIACPKCASREVTRRMSTCAHTVAGGSSSPKSSGHSCSGNCSGGCSCGHAH